MAKKKEWKKTIDEINIINNLKIYVNKYAGRTNFIKSVDFEEQTYDEHLRFVVTLDCGSFRQKIIYYNTMLFESDFIDTEFHFDNSEYDYTFYDIFNLFDIDDFELYYYKNVNSAEDVENVVKSIIEATESYLYYLEKAGSEAYISDLEKNYETDMDSCYGSSDWKEEEEDIEDGFVILADNHIIFTYADGQMTEKAIKKLKKKSEKGKLDTIYEKRLLKYIEAGNRVDRKNIVDKEEFEKAYSRKNLLMDVIVFISSFVFFTVLYFDIHSVMFKGAVVYPLTWNIFGKEMALYLNKLITFVFAAVMATVEIRFLFGKRLMIKSMPKDMKNRVEDKYKKEDKDRYGKLEKPVKIIGGILIPFFIVLFFASVFDDVGYYDTYVRYNSSVAFETLDVNYEDLEIYKIKYSYDEDDESAENENAYAISDGNGNYYDYGELEKNGKAETKLKEIAEKYNKEIIEIDTIDELNSDISE